MRDILFKAKRLDNGKEVEGYYWTNGFGNHFIRQTIDEKGNFCTNDIEIEPDSLCQYVENLSGKKLWENDVIEVKIPYRNLVATGTIKFGFCDNGYESHLCFYIDWGRDDMRRDLAYWLFNGFEVIGNTSLRPVRNRKR